MINEEQIDVRTLTDCQINIVRHGNLVTKSLLEVAEDIYKEEGDKFDSLYDAYFELIHWGYDTPNGTEEEPLTYLTVADYLVVPFKVSEAAENQMILNDGEIL